MIAPANISRSSCRISIFQAKERHEWPGGRRVSSVVSDGSIARDHCNVFFFFFIFFCVRRRVLRGKLKSPLRF